MVLVAHAPDAMHGIIIAAELCLAPECGPKLVHSAPVQKNKQTKSVFQTPNKTSKDHPTQQSVLVNTAQMQQKTAFQKLTFQE
jgi:hypothetical protein